MCLLSGTNNRWNGNTAEKERNHLGFLDLEHSEIEVGGTGRVIVLRQT